MKKSSRDHACKIFGRRAKRVHVAIILVIGFVAAIAIASGTPAIIKMKRPPDATMPPSLLTHWKHQRSYKCYACHPGTFSQWKKAVFDHVDMEEGKYCGACHNGKVAFRPDNEDCEVCHAE